MKLKRIAATLLASAMVVGLAACGGGSSSSSGGTASTGSGGTKPSAGGSLTINIWDSNQQAGLQEIVDDCHTIFYMVRP